MGVCLVERRREIWIGVENDKRGIVGSPSPSPSLKLSEKAFAEGELRWVDAGCAEGQSLVLQILVCPRFPPIPCPASSALALLM